MEKEFIDSLIKKLTELNEQEKQIDENEDSSEEFLFDLVEEIQDKIKEIANLSIRKEYDRMNLELGALCSSISFSIKDYEEKYEDKHE